MFNFKHFLRCIAVVCVLAAVIAPAFSTLALAAAPAADPTTVTIAGTLQSELGCPGDWMPDCNKTDLKLDKNDGIWKGEFEVTPNNDQDQQGPRYKAAIDGSWSVNYGKNAANGGSDIPLVVDKATKVKFYFDPNSHWVTDNFNTPIVVATGDFQKQLGCSKDNDPTCMRGWLEDPAGSGAYAFTTTALKAGTYQVTLAINDVLPTATESAQPFTVAKDGDEIYFGYDAVKKALTISTSGAPRGSLDKLKAVWVNQDTILWNVAGSAVNKYSLIYSPDASLSLSPTGITGGNEIQLSYSASGPGGDVFVNNPYLTGWSAFKINPADFGVLPEAVKGQLAVIARDDKGKVIDATGVQLAGALDGLFSYTGPLGVTFVGGIPTIGVWTPTAKSVKLHLFADAATTTEQVIPMTADPKTGLWSVTGQPDWKGQFYLFEVQVYVPSTGKIETNLVTDPYSFSLSTNSLRSQIVDLTDTSLKPQGWENISKPALAAPEDNVVYELQVRDFSISDQTVPEALRGTFKAFTVTDSDGMKHLAALAKAGLTDVHLLPVFDIASVDEDKSTWKTVDSAKLATYPPDSTQQSAAVSLIKSQDGFNWGYDPYHFTVPEGSYTTDPNGTPRIIEFRQMVAALNQIGLRVVMDVVYNHTTESGQNPKSVLDKIVPGYYYRLNTEGSVETATCCQDTATEHTMMRKLMVDSIVTWAKQYKVDGFRFDLMGFHMLSDMQAVRAALDALTPAKDGVDGKSIYIYGEGWDFGEVANGARGINATQLNIGGTGIGVFNDRLRDAVRGGSPFTDPRAQGFSTGLFLDPNAAETLQPAAQKNELLATTDWIRLGLAGNLRDYKLVKASGDLVDGAHIIYNGAPAGYTLDPQENIVYVSAHDNQTIFDAVQAKAPASASLADRIRMNNLALSIPMFSQGVPFFHAGDDILRSKSLDGNSYDSGDWFNKLDWTLTSDNWGVGLPMDAGSNASIYAPLLADPRLKPGKTEITNAGAVFQEFLAIRKSSPLFHLQTAEQVSKAVTFLNTGPDQVPGLIVMVLADPANLDPNYSGLVVLFNANQNGLKFADVSFSGKEYTLHPVLQNSVDPVARTASFDSASGTFSVPGRTTTVFTLKKAPEPTAQPTVPPPATAQPQPTLPITSTATAQLQPTAVPVPPETAGVSIPLVLGIVAGIAVVIAFFVWRRGNR